MSDAQLNRKTAGNSGDQNSTEVCAHCGSFLADTDHSAFRSQLTELDDEDENDSGHLAEILESMQTVCQKCIAEKRLPPWHFDPQIAYDRRRSLWLLIGSVIASLLTLFLSAYALTKSQVVMGVFVGLFGIGIVGMTLIHFFVSIFEPWLSISSIEYRVWLAIFLIDFALHISFTSLSADRIWNIF